MTSRVRAASIVDTPLSVDRLLAYVSEPGVGGIALFIGLVRDHDSGHPVASLDYTQHPSAGEALRRCAERVADRFEVRAVAVEHRVGHLLIGDLAVVVAVGAAHRAAALEACRALIDTLKDEVPIWKEQEFASGQTHWVGLESALEHHEPTQR